MTGNFFVVLGNQLFEPNILLSKECTHVYMAEDFGLCTYQRHHKLKLYLFLCSMREYRDELTAHGIRIDYLQLEEKNRKLDYASLLLQFVREKEIGHLNFFEIEDKFFENQIISMLKKNSVNFTFHANPMFMITREEFIDWYGKNKTFRLAHFYKNARKKFDILVDEEKNPFGGQWSFDEENRKKIPKHLSLPFQKSPEKSKYHNEILNIIDIYFSEHPGETENVWFPVKRKDAEAHLDEFLENKLDNFGIYEDAMVQGKNFLFHSCLSALLNIGLITPEVVIKKTVDIFERRNAPLNSVEGFIRQILGWREFIRGIYQIRSDEQQSRNYWGHYRKIGSCWYEGNTGILPLDDSIKSVLRDGYNHHIPRLMVICNILNLCAVNPDEIFKWFMEMYIDSSDWVMVPNVYGMATFSDGGLMSTKPYTCSSNYILKMSNYSKGDWCDTVDGLYWQFEEKHKIFYSSNVRLAFQVNMLKKLSEERKEKIFSKANKFIEETTIL